MSTGEAKHDFRIDDLSEFGENEARRLAAAGYFSGRRAAHSLRAALRALESARGEGGAYEWLADNRYLIEREARLAARAFASVRRVGAGRENALVSEAAFSLSARLRGELSAESAAAFLEGFQRVRPLSLTELTLLGAALRSGLIELLRSEFASGAPDAGLAGAAISSLRRLASEDMGELMDAVDIPGGILAQESCGVYARMDERTRAMYRRRLAKLAKREGLSETELAGRVLALAEEHRGEEKRGHVGWWLLAEPLGRKKRAASGAAYALAVLLLSLAAGALCAPAGGWSGFVLALLPASEFMKNALDALLLRRLPPRILPRMEIKDGVPPSGRCVCVISAILSRPSDGPALARRLEEFRHASRECGEELRFGLLADLPEAAEEHMSGDGPAVQAAKRAVDALNEKYSGGFYLFFRPRSEAARDRVWRGRERKRGALLSLAGLCSGRESELRTLSGDVSALAGTRYIITLDADTRVLPGSAAELIGAMLHPLNRAELDSARRCVRAGRGLIHPRMGVELSASGKSIFSRVTAGPGGIEPYSSACGEVWMDLTGRGGFAGKGIIDIAALLECCSGLPENLVLSHDAVEGALLRGGYMGDTLLTDGCPASPWAYFRRQHRWVRGDWQNLAVLVRLPGRLSLADRLKLFDSVRRSLAAPAALAAMVLALLLPGSGLGAAGILAALSLCSGLPGAVVHALTRRSGRERHPGGALYGAALRMGQAVLRLVLLPWEAWVNLSAAASALWRALVSHRKLLEWQTAAQSAASARGAAVLAAWPCLALGAAVLLLSPSPAGKALGIVWLAAPFLSVSLGAPQRRGRPLREDERRFLLGQCEKIWRYFENFCTEERGFLPPDNYQEQPPVGAAERTSPTNIGLALVSAAAAADLGVAERGAALRLIECLLDTCEKLEKWRGHLYNWYGTRSALPLEPRYVSTVDSGNLAASLTALAAALEEYARPGLAARARALRDGMDFAALYDKSRRLFRIGYDASEGRLSEGCYDLMASEARLTGYYAVAHGDVSVRHWRQLSRALLGRDGYRGLASWTGTMFEYLMPELFLPLERGSLLWESARFCLYVQRRDLPRGLPWGQSESAFFALDAGMSYRYKAHGCAALALQRGMERDSVAAPYASYLALAVSPHAAVRNLRRFAQIDPGGRWGLWEAVDFTARRCAGGRGEVVRCVMAHHLGMSLVAAANCLLDGIMQRRFMSEPDMAAFSPLLGEQAPEGAVLLRRRAVGPQEREKPRPMSVALAEGACAPGGDVSVFPLSNGVYSALCSENGLNRSCAGGISIYRGFDGSLHSPAGLRFSLDTRSERVDLQPLPGAEGGLAFRYRLHGGLLRFDGEREDLACSLITGVPAQDTAELRIVEISSTRALGGVLTLEFEPTLAREADYEAHPAYWRLGLSAGVRDGALLIRRLPRSGLGGCWLCAASDAGCSFRANIDGEALGALSHPYVTIRTPVELAAGGRIQLRFALAFAATEDDALAAARRTLACGAGRLADLCSSMGAVLGLAPEELLGLPALAGRLCFPRVNGENPPAREELWAAGISGDFPICAAYTDRDGAHAAGAAAVHTLLGMAGVRSDLVFITGDGADYHRPETLAVTRALAAAGLDAQLGRRAGIHCVTRERAAAVESSAAAVLEPNGSLRERARPVPAAAAEPARPRRGGGAEYSAGPGVFRFTVKGALPRRAWTLPLSNGRFGYLAADCGLGGMWADNARERRVNAWLCDERAAAGPETLEAETGEGRFSLFAAEDGAECRVEFGLGYAVWEKLGARLTAFVPLELAARVFIIENAPGRVLWHTSLQLSSGASDAVFTVTRAEDGLLFARNARSGMEFAAAFSAAAEAFTCDEAAWLAGKPAGETGAGLSPCFGAVLPRAETLIIVCGCCSPEELRALAEPERARLELAYAQERYSRLCRRFEFSTGRSELDCYLNGWAVYQILVCRMLARCSLYQSGGAFGFRDQLQDAVNLLPVDPGFALERIIDCCAHQYAEGDVMHWWHPGAPDRGVRTRISDDLVWLPWAVCEYIDATGDLSLLSRRVEGLASPRLAEGEHSRYESAAPSGEGADVLAHAAMALRCVLRRGFGPHGLLLMGSGDWCDGFDAVGGESVWLTEFFVHTARRLAKLLDTPSAAALTSAVRRCERALEGAWDGGWYLRGWFADGRPLGSRDSAGCRIDSIAQSWAAFAHCDGERVRAALAAAYGRLHDAGTGITKLFDPPFGPGTEYAGYVNSYGEGFRENGGQYTHGAVWLALACLEHGMRAEAESILCGLLADRGAEPFVLPADVYTNPDRYGEAGWSWYTGSAGWFFRAALRLWGPDRDKNPPPQ